MVWLLSLKNLLVKVEMELYCSTKQLLMISKAFLPENRSRSFLILVASLGYFVDIYDLLLFGIVRIPSLESMGLDA